MMNWIFGRPKSNLPEPTALQAQKSKQIEQLKTFNVNVTEIHRDIEYRVNCVINGTNISIYITLPPQFPHEKPSVKVAPPMRHLWINDQMQVIGCPGINNFVVHSDLGKEIRSVVEEMQRNPPTILPPSQQPYGAGLPYPLPPGGNVRPQPPTLPTYTPYSQPSVSSYMPTVAMPTLPAVAPAPASNTPYPPHQPQQQVTTGGLNGYMLPDMPVNFPQIEQLSLEELQQLAGAEDEDKLLEEIMKLPQVQKISQDRQELAASNEALARENLELKPALEEKKRQLLEKYDEMNDLRQVFDQCCQKQEALHDQFDVSSLQANIKVAALQAEEEAEQIAENFVKGKISVDEFKQKYMQKRKSWHLRKSKEEKLAHYILQNRGAF